jgi:hypothetical protein
MRHELWQDFFQELEDADIRLYCGDYIIEGMKEEFFCEVTVEELYQHFKNRLLDYE